MSEADPGLPAAPTPRRSPRVWPLFVVVAAMILVPFVFWRMTWFGRRLADDELASALAPGAKIREIQHGLAEMSNRLDSGDKAGARPFYPKVVELAAHDEAAVRRMAAWVMGRDNGHEPFHEALRTLLGDHDLLVRQNAALALTPFGDDAARPVLVEMLSSLSIRAAEGGTIENVLGVANRVRPGLWVVRYRDAKGELREVASPVEGEIDWVKVAEGARMAPGDELLSIRPSENQVVEALKGLYLVGKPADLQAVERHVEGVAGFSEKVREQANFTARRIGERASAAGASPE